MAKLQVQSLGVDDFSILYPLWAYADKKASEDLMWDHLRNERSRVIGAYRADKLAGVLALRWHEQAVEITVLASKPKNDKVEASLLDEAEVIAGVWGFNQLVIDKPRRTEFLTAQGFTAVAEGQWAKRFASRAELKAQAGSKDKATV